MYFVMQSLLTYGLSIVNASVSAIMLYVTIPVSYMLDIFFMGKQVGVLECIGAVMIVGINVIIGILKWRGCIN